MVSGMATTTTPEDDILTIREVMRLLGVGQRTIDRYVSEGLLPAAYLPSGHRRFRRGDVDALLTRRSA